MPPRYCDSLRNSVEDLLRAGVVPRDIAQGLRVSKQWISNLSLNLEAFGTATPGTMSVQGRPRKIHHEALDGLRSFLIDDPCAYLDELQDFLYHDYNIEASLPTIARAIEKLGISRKKVQRVHTEQDEGLRRDWQAKLTQWKSNQLVFVDESASNERTKDRTRGWSTKGIPCRVSLSAKRSTRWSILPAIGLNGYLTWDIYHGSFDSQRFLNFIRHLLTKMQRFPAARSVLVMDNCRTHFNKELLEACDEVGVKLEYLPPYSPDFNPIEESFSALKAWMRRHRDLIEGFGSFFEGFVTLGLLEVGVKDAARGYFRSAKIIVEEDDWDEDYNNL